MAELASSWKYYQLALSGEPSQKSWADSLRTVGTIRTIPELLYTLDEIEKSGFENINDLNFFKGEIKPMWEDASNINGGRCIMEIPVSCRENLPDIWRTTVALCCLNVFESITGCVFNEKANFRVAIWVSDMRETDAIIKAWKDVVRSSHYVFSVSLHNKYADGSKSRKRVSRNK